MSKVKQDRWTCRFCKANGWWTPSTHIGGPPTGSHDRPQGGRCRKSEEFFQKGEEEIAYYKERLQRAKDAQETLIKEIRKTIDDTYAIKPLPWGGQ